MKRLVPLCFLPLLLSQGLVAHADDYRLGGFRLALIDDPWSVEFQGAKQASPQNFEQVVKIVGAPRGWKVVNATEGRIELTNLVRDRHMMLIEVTYDATGYRIRYLKSANLDYGEQKRGSTTLRVIHSNYNGWIKDLVSDINAGLGAPARTTVGFAPLAKVDSVPFINAKGRDGYAEFLTWPTPRAFVIAPNGAWGRGFARSSSWRGDVVEYALENCNRRGQGQCGVYAIDEHVVWPAAGTAK